MFLRFNDSNKKYECKIEKLENDIKVIFYEDYEPNTSGFQIYSDDGKILGSYPDHKVIKQSFADGFLYSTSAEEECKDEPLTLGKLLENSNKKIEELNKELNETKEALDCTNNAVEELLFNYILKEDGGNTSNE